MLINSPAEVCTIYIVCCGVCWIYSFGRRLCHKNLTFCLLNFAASYRTLAIIFLWNTSDQISFRSTICYICILVSLEVHQSSKEFHSPLMSSSRCWQERAPHTPVWHSAISVLSLFLWLSQPPILMSMLSGKQLNLSCTNWLLGRFHNKIPVMAVYCSRVAWLETSSYLLTHSI